MAMRGFLSSAIAVIALALTTGCGDEPDTEPEPPCQAASGHACVWLGTGAEGFNGDGHDCLDTDIAWSMDMAFAPDGTAWFIDWNNHLVRKVLPDQTVVTVVGWTYPIYPGDGTGDATENTPPGADGASVRLNHPTELYIAADGAVLLMAWHNHKLRRIDPETGEVMILAGAGVGFAGDGGPMKAALFKQPKSLTGDADGNLYIGDQQNFRVRKIDSEGVITTIVGAGVQGTAGDGGPALEAELNWEIGSNPEPSGGLAIAGGKLYIADTLSHRIRVVDLETNVIDAFAGTGEPGYSGDDGPALEATFSAPRELEIGPDGNLYVADTDNHVIRAVDLESGIVRTVVGTGEPGRDAKDGLLATETHLARPFGLEFDADGNLYVMDTLNSRILKVTR
jgi:DNA-binding beta-propeller fold protein YncE